MASKHKKHTLAVWIDVEKAFDKVWENGLRLKLQQSEGLHVPEKKTCQNSVQKELGREI